MFDLQRFGEPTFGLLSATDKAKITSGGIMSLKVTDDYIYFYKNATATGTAAISLQRLKGFWAMYSGNATGWTFANGYLKISGGSSVTFLPLFGEWTVTYSNGTVKKLNVTSPTIYTSSNLYS